MDRATKLKLIWISGEGLSPSAVGIGYSRPPRWDMEAAFLSHAVLPVLRRGVEIFIGDEDPQLGPGVDADPVSFLKKRTGHFSFFFFF